MPRSTGERRVTVWMLPLAAVALVACRGAAEPERRRIESGRHTVEVVFKGEVDDDALFGTGRSLLDHVHPLDAERKKVGTVTDASPGWLHFDYELDGVRREVLIAKRPLMNRVSWSDIARVGAALGDDSLPPEADVQAAQSAVVRANDGNDYRVRLLLCGASTLAHLSEWNLLIGAVHRGDMDFTGPDYGWISSPYDNSDLKVGFNGSLSWCTDAVGPERVARGYFFVSRFHAAAPTWRTDRLRWRPVLERMRQPSAPPTPLVAPLREPPDAAPSDLARGVEFLGRVPSDQFLGPGNSIVDQIEIRAGEFVGNARPDWLHYRVDGRELWVASQAVKHSLTWDDIAAAGAALGDGSSVRVGWQWHPQDATAQDHQGRRYRVRLLACGASTLDWRSEWNRLMGVVHEPDADFALAGARPAAGVVESGHRLGTGMAAGNTSWCQERIRIGFKQYAVNRGFFTLSRFHATETGHQDIAFGWRPVLERER